MIRQDYLMRLAHALAQALFHKKQHDYLRAEAEISAALRECFDLPPATSPDLDPLLAACAAAGEATPENLARLADLFHEQGDIRRLRGDLHGAARSDALALGVFLELLQTTIVSFDLIHKTEALIQQIPHGEMPSAVLRRLVGYYEARGMFARAEDVLHQWLATKDPAAMAAGTAFYNRLLAKSDADLDAGGLPRPEVEQGRAEWSQLTSDIP